MDIKTLAFVTAAISLCSAIVIFFIHRLRFRERGILFWVYGTIAIAFALVLLSLRSTLTDFITIVFANTLITYGFALIWSGMRMFTGRRYMLKTSLIAPLSIAPFLFWYSQVQPSLWIRVIVCSFAIAVFSGASAYELLIGGKWRTNLAQSFTGIVFLLNTGIFSIRIFLQF